MQDLRTETICHIGSHAKELRFLRRQKNPYAGRMKKQVTIRLEEATIAYFKNLADEVGVPYQTLINLYLRDCAATGRRLALEWKSDT